MKRLRRCVVAAAVLGPLLLVAAPTVWGRVHTSHEDAIRIACGDSLHADTRTAFLTPEQVERIRRTARVPEVPERVTWTACTDSAGTPRLHLYLDRHLVRTYEETVLVAIRPDGSVAWVEVLAFHEPEDYLAPPGWLGLWRGRTRAETLVPGRDLPNLSGATLTARSLAGAVRRTLALHEVLAPAADER